MSTSHTLSVKLRCLLVLVLTLVLQVGHAQDYDTTTITEEVSADDRNEYQPDDDHFLDLSSLTTHDSIVMRRVSPEKIRAMKDDEDFWYADLSYADAVSDNGKDKANARQRSPGDFGWLRSLLWIFIIGGFIAFLVTYLANANVRMFRKRSRTFEEEQEDLEMPEDIFAINYQREIDKAASAGNYRLAVRLMYLRLLKKLSERNVINYTQDKTNFDYLLQLHPTPYYKDFFRITRHYEYSWYGQFPVSDEAYRFIRQDIDHFERGI